MPLILYPKCWRGRDDCEPIHCIDGTDDDLTDEQLETLDYKPNSFVCSGRINKPNVAQDIYRLCFKSEATDEMTDNDLQDLSSIVAVIGAALTLDAVTKVNNGIVEIPAQNGY